MSQPDMSIFKPHMQFADKETGKIVFEMKRKHNEDYGGSGIYYLFKIHEENFSNPDDKDLFMNMFFPTIKLAAAKMSIALFDVTEMGERMQEKVSKILETGVDLDKRQVDVKLELMNYATGELQHLTIGVSTRPADELKEPPVKLEES